MLVISRKPGEKVLIGENITVTVVRIGPNTVRLGIEAPREVNIVRQELVVEFGSPEETDAFCDAVPNQSGSSDDGNVAVGTTEGNGTGFQ